MRPPKATEFTPEEEEAIEKLEEDTATYLESHPECMYNTNVGLGTPDHLRDEVWDEFVRRANKAGYSARRQGAVVTIKNPKG